MDENIFSMFDAPPASPVPSAPAPAQESRRRSSYLTNSHSAPYPNEMPGPGSIPPSGNKYNGDKSHIDQAERLASERLAAADAANIATPMGNSTSQYNHLPSESNYTPGPRPRVASGSTQLPPTPLPNMPPPVPNLEARHSTPFSNHNHNNTGSDPYNVYPEEHGLATGTALPEQSPGYYTTTGTLKPAQDITRNLSTRSRKNDKNWYMPQEVYDEKNVDINGEIRSTNSKKYIEGQLYSRVLTGKLMDTPYFVQATLGLGEDAISINSLMHILEIVMSVTIIILCSKSIGNDIRINHSVWEYLISAAGILLAISFLFLFKVMNFEHNNGIFYCLVGTGLSISSMGVVIGILLPTPCINNEGRCELRKAETALVCVAALLWLINLVQFLTVFYISRLDNGRTLQSPVDFVNQNHNHNIDPQQLPQQQQIPAHIDTKRYSDQNTLIPTSTSPYANATTEYRKSLAATETEEPVNRPIRSYVLDNDALYEADDENVQGKKLRKVELYANPKQ